MSATDFKDAFIDIISILSEPSDIRHDFHGFPASREMLGATPTTIYGNYQPQESL